MKKIIIIARYTMLHLYHQGLLPLTVLLFAAILGASAFFGGMMLGSYYKVLCDGALASYQLLSLCLALFFIVPFFSGKEQRGLIGYFIVGMASRTQFLYGAALGFALITFILMLATLVGSLVVLYALTGIFFGHLVSAWCALFIEALFIGALALCASIFFRRPLASCCVIAGYLIAYANCPWYQAMQNTTPYGNLAATTLHLLLPNLAGLDIKQQVIYQMPFELITFYAAAVHTLLYSALLVSAAHVGFKKVSLI